MAIDRSNNPMVFTSADCTSSIMFSTPCTVNQILWTSIEASASCHLADMDGNPIFDGIAEGATRIIEDPTVLANGLRLTTSVGVERGKVFVWVR